MTQGRVIHTPQFDELSLPTEAKEMLRHGLGNCATTGAHGGEFIFEGLGDITESFLTGTPFLDDVGGHIEIINNTWRWLINGVEQAQADWVDPDVRNHVIQGGCGLRIKGPLVVEGPIDGWNVGAGRSKCIMLGQAATTITAQSGGTPGSGAVDILDSTGTATGEQITASNMLGTTIADDEYVVLGHMADDTYTIMNYGTMTDEPAAAPVGELYGDTWPASFPVEGINYTDNGCSSSSLLNVRSTVNYIGEIYKPAAGTVRYHVWESADDIFGSPGVCSGILDDKKFYVYVDIQAGTVGVSLYHDDKVFTDSYNSGGGSPGVSYQYDSAAKSLTYQHGATHIDMTMSSVYDTGDFTHANPAVRLHPFGT